jgi:hypothetical protein
MVGMILGFCCGLKGVSLTEADPSSWKLAECLIYKPGDLAPPSNRTQMKAVSLSPAEVPCLTSHTSYFHDAFKAHCDCGLRNHLRL